MDIFRAQLDAYRRGEPLDHDAVLNIPSVDKEVAIKMFQAPPGREGRDARIHSYIAYKKNRKLLIDYVRANACTPARDRKSIFHRARSSTDLWDELVDIGPQRPVLVPEAMPVVVPPLTEFKSIMCFLETSGGTRVDTLSTFGRGALYPDGRVDMCKQVLGPDWIKKFTTTVESSGSTVRHFLLGNNIVGRPGALAIADLISSRPNIETWYLAGNLIDYVGMRAIARAMENDPASKALWLKRNPLGVQGAVHVADLLRKTTTLEVLDLSNTNIGDAGCEAIMSAMYENTSLRVLYLDSNGITARGAAAIGAYMFSGSARLERLYMSMNPLKTEGVRAMAHGLRESRNLVGLCLASCRFDARGMDILTDVFAKSTTLQFLGVGHYKATADMGELCNSLRVAGARSIVKLLRTNRSIRVLDISVAHIPIEGLEFIADALEEGSSVTSLSYGQYGVKIPAALRQRLNAFDTMKLHDRRVLQHSERVVDIDSIYRNTM